MTQDIVERLATAIAQAKADNDGWQFMLEECRAEIKTTRAERDEYIRQCKEALHDAAEAKDDAHKHWVDKVNAEAERDEAKAEHVRLRGIIDCGCNAIRDAVALGGGDIARIDAMQKRMRREALKESS